MKDFVKKVLRMRKAMVRRGCSMKNQMRVHKAIELFERYFGFYPNVKDESVIKYCEKHLEELRVLMPGKGSSSFEKLNKELNQYITL